MIVAPQILPLTFGDEPVNAGDLASIQCAISKGDFPLEITWMFNGQPISSNEFDVIISDSGKRIKQLTIESVTSSNAGTYECIASNPAGSTSSMAVLDVNGTIIATFVNLLIDPSLKIHVDSVFPFFLSYMKLIQIS